MLFYIGSVVILLILYGLLRSKYGSKVREWLANIKKTTEAKLLARSTVNVNEQMHQRKSLLIHDGLCRLKDQTGRPLTILEIGAGAGANFEFYPDGTKVICVEPNDKTESYMRKNAEKFPKVCLEKIYFGCAENMEQIGSNSIDAVVSTFVMCRVKDIDQCLKEVIRVLKPNGEYIFLEHVATRHHHSLLGLAQFLLRVPFMLLLHSRIAHDTEANIRKANFSSVEVEYFEAHEAHHSAGHVMSKLARCHISGIATK